MSFSVFLGFCVLGLFGNVCVKGDTKSFLAGSWYHHEKGEGRQYGGQIICGIKEYMRR